MRATQTETARRINSAIKERRRRFRKKPGVVFDSPMMPRSYILQQRLLNIRKEIRAQQSRKKKKPLYDRKKMFLLILVGGMIAAWITGRNRKSDSLIPTREKPFSVKIKCNGNCDRSVERLKSFIRERKDFIFTEKAPDLLISISQKSDNVWEADIVSRVRGEGKKNQFQKWRIFSQGNPNENAFDKLISDIIEKLTPDG